MKANGTIHTCKQYPINDRVSDTLQPAFRKRQIMTAWSQCHTVYVVSFIWIKMAQMLVDTIFK